MLSVIGLFIAPRAEYLHRRPVLLRHARDGPLCERLVLLRRFLVQQNFIRQFNAICVTPWKTS